MTGSRIHPAQPVLEAGQPSAYASRFVLRHLDRGSLAFADGHVECVPASVAIKDGIAKVPQKELVWTADPDVDPNIAE